MAKEYIEREALIRYTEKQEVIIKDGTSIADAMSIQGNVFRRCVETCPAADVVEVVRCKDCKFFIPDAELDHNEYPNIIEADGLCNGSLKFTYADDFCSCGERNEV